MSLARRRLHAVVSQLRITGSQHHAQAIELFHKYELEPHVAEADEKTLFQIGLELVFQSAEQCWIGITDQDDEDLVLLRFQAFDLADEAVVI